VIAMGPAAAPEAAPRIAADPAHAIVMIMIFQLVLVMRVSLFA